MQNASIIAESRTAVHAGAVCIVEFLFRSGFRHLDALLISGAAAKCVLLHEKV